ncbi:MAG: ketoacyl-ACP synthase III [Candidatus Hydrogenedentes bacterium]|nr:ketoacyl-ACP synthase III [Candidatus Hydrogenedentota bacterium]
MVRARIIGTGQHLPEKVLTNLDLEKMMDTTDEWIRQRTGIKQRYVAANGQGASDLGGPAAARAIEAAGIDPKEIDLIICCTTTPDYLFPASACLIQHQVGATKAAAYDVNAACSGFVCGLTTANAYIQAGIYKTIVIVGTEVVTSRLNWKKRDTAVLFGDGAGAVVVRAENGDHGILSTFLGADGGSGDLLILPGGGSRNVVTKENVDTGVHDISMKGPELFKKAVVVFGEAVQQALTATGLAINDIDVFIPHQANTRIIYAAADRIGLPQEKVFLNIDRVANTTAASIPIAIDDAVTQGRIRSGSIVLLAAFGAGITWGSIMLRW